MGGAGRGGEVWNWAGEEEVVVVVVVVLKPCMRRLGAECSFRRRW